MGTDFHAPRRSCGQSMTPKITCWNCGKRAVHFYVVKLGGNMPWGCYTGKTLVAKCKRHHDRGPEGNSNWKEISEEEFIVFQVMQS